VTIRNITRLRDLRAAGATYPEAHRVVAGLDRLSAGAYADTSGLPAEGVHVLRLAAHLGDIEGMVASHASAAVLWGLPVRTTDLTTVHLSPRPGRRGKPKAGVGYHVHTPEVAAAEMQMMHDLPTTAPLRTVLDCARVMDLDWGVVIADSSLHRGLVGVDELAEAAGGIRRTHGAARARSLPSLCSSAAESPGESLLRLRLHRMGLAPEEQVSMPWVQGSPRVDFLVGNLVIEFDGQSKYELDGDPARAHWEEKRRHDRLVEAGYEVLHVVWAELWNEPALRARIDRALQRTRLRAAS
jgi:very-short-patch-repair endonuclease